MGYGDEGWFIYQRKRGEKELSALIKYFDVRLMFEDGSVNRYETGTKTHKSV